MGLNAGSSGSWYKVAYGKVRRATTEDDPMAKRRDVTDKDGNVTSVLWERVYKSVTGKLIGLTEHEHEKYGRSWGVHIQDGSEVFILKIGETSRYGSDLLKKIPNMKVGVTYTINPYDFTPQGEDKARVGLSIVDETTGGKVQSYFHEFTGTGKDMVVTAINGYPEAEPTMSKDWDKDDWKIYFLKATKAMRGVALKHVHNPEPIDAVPAGVDEEDSDLNF